MKPFRQNNFLAQVRMKVDVRRIAVVVKGKRYVLRTANSYICLHTHTHTHTHTKQLHSLHLPAYTIHVQVDVHVHVRLYMFTVCTLCCLALGKRFKFSNHMCVHVYAKHPNVRSLLSHWKDTTQSLSTIQVHVHLGMKPPRHI